MKNLIVLSFFLISTALIAQNAEVMSPDSKLKLNVTIESGIPVYAVSYNGKAILENSPLGLKTNEGNFIDNISFVESTPGQVGKTYEQDRIKQSIITYEVNSLKYTIKHADNKQIAIVFQVSNNDVAFRYESPAWGETMACVVTEEATGYKFPAFATSFLSPMMGPMTAF